MSSASNSGVRQQAVLSRARLLDPATGIVTDCDIVVEDGRISCLAPPASRAGAIDCAGALVLPGLNDAHAHLLAAAARSGWWDVGPSHARSIADILGVIHEAAEKTPPGQWIRAGAYDEWRLHEKRHPTRAELDRAAPDHPVRLIHRSYHACVLNSAAVRRTGVDRADGLVVEPSSVPSLRLPPPDEGSLDDALARVGSDLLRWGVTCVQDASPANTAATVELVARIAERRPFPRVTMMSGPQVWPEVVVAAAKTHDRVRAGHVKVLATNGELGLDPDPDSLCEIVRRAEAEGADVAIHTVEEATAVLALHAFLAAGSGARRSRRIEHGALLSPALESLLRQARVAVVTNPGFVAANGDRYAVEVDQLPWLYRARTLVQAGVVVAAGSDLPIGPANPWTIMRAAFDRRTDAGALLGGDERLTAGQAIRLLTTAAARVDAGKWGCGRIVVGAPADLIVLDRAARTIDDVLAIPDSPVRLTMLRGDVVWQSSHP